MSGWTFRHSVAVAAYLILLLCLSVWSVDWLRIVLIATLAVHILANLEARLR